ncbi:MAG: hypothetical protein WC553_01790 [Patescibacteria group bacterium]
MGTLIGGILLIQDAQAPMAAEADIFRTTLHLMAGGRGRSGMIAV